MMTKENSFQVMDNRVGNEHQSQSETEDLGTQSRYSLDKEAGLPTCRVCQCAESDKRGDAALGFLGITPPLPRESDGVKPESKDVHQNNKNNDCSKKDGMESGMIKFISPDGEVFICNNDIEMGPRVQPNALIELGCSCKNDLSLVHYACALKWFVNHGSTICEICGHVAKNIRNEDFKKVVVSLKDYEALIERTSSGDPNPAQVLRSSGVDPDAIAAIRRQRLSEISLWFNPRRSNNYNSSTAVPHVVSEEPLTTVAEEAAPAVHPATKWAVEGVGILVATGLLTVTLAWLIAPRVGKKTAKSGLHILLGGLCALTVVVFFRFFVLTRIKYGPARYWAILFVFWFLVFGIWASRTRGAHIT